MYYNKGIIMQFSFGQGQQVTNVLKVMVQQCRNAQKGCWLCVLCYQHCETIISAGSFVSGLILFFICSPLFSVYAWILWTVLCVCVPSNPAPSARLGVETDFITDTEATLICCKRSGNWPPLAGVMKWIAELCCLSAALLCWHCTRDGHPSGKYPFLRQGHVLPFDLPVGQHSRGQPWSCPALTTVSFWQPQSHGCGPQCGGFTGSTGF